MKTTQQIATVNNSSVATLVSLIDNQPTTNSLLVANKFNKRHANVSKAIGNMISANSKLSWLYKSATYKDEQGKQRPMYLMNRDGFTLLVMGFTGKDALEFKLDYINAFNAMEQQLREIQQRGLVSANCLQLEQERTAFWKGQSDYWCNHSAAITETMGIMSANQLHLAELLRDKTESQPTGDYWKDMYTKTVEIVCRMSDNMQDLSKIVSKKTNTPEVTSSNKVIGVKKQIQQLEAAQVAQPVAKKKPALRPKKEPKYYYSVVGYATLKDVFLGIKKAAELGRKASALCRAKGIKTEEIPDPRFGRVKTYPESVLKEVFATAECR